MKRDLICVVLVICAGCAGQKASRDAESGPALRALGESVTPDETRSDEAIGFDIRGRLNQVGLAQTGGVIVEVSDGIVTLSGAAPTLAAAWQAEAATHGVKGVKKVFNKIIVTSTNY